MSVRLERSFPSEAIAERIVRALAVDDPGTFRVEREGRRVVLEVSGPTAGAVRRTVDDLLAGVLAAERTAGLGRPGRPRTVDGPSADPV